jgi:hypothetical protein
VPQIFEPGADTCLRFAAVGALVVVVGGALVGGGFVRSSWFTGLGNAPGQPVPFSHARHVGGLGIECRYCHTQVETQASSGFPPTHTCMSCHSQIWTGAEALRPVRRSLAQGEPLRWNRVYDLPDFVYFDHSIPVDRMPQVRQANPMTMGWCLACHRDPASVLGDPDAVTRSAAELPTPAQAQARAAHFGIEAGRLDHCYVCHR